MVTISPDSFILATSGGGDGGGAGAPTVTVTICVACAAKLVSCHVRWVESVTTIADSDAAVGPLLIMSSEAHLAGRAV